MICFHCYPFLELGVCFIEGNRYLLLKNQFHAWLTDLLSLLLHVTVNSFVFTQLDGEDFAQSGPSVPLVGKNFRFVLLFLLITSGILKTTWDNEIPYANIILFIYLFILNVFYGAAFSVKYAYCYLLDINMQTEKQWT